MPHAVCSFRLVASVIPRVCSTKRSGGGRVDGLQVGYVVRSPSLEVSDVFGRDPFVGATETLLDKVLGARDLPVHDRVLVNVTLLRAPAQNPVLHQPLAVRE